MSSIYFSNAKWTKVKNSDDKHCRDTEKEAYDFAKAICKVLLEKYGLRTRGCEVRGHCLKTWITNESEEILEVFNAN